MKNKINIVCVSEPMFKITRDHNVISHSTLTAENIIIQNL